jgi:ubiquinone/menaquinone biosynthesis C-methylase UbiE
MTPIATGRGADPHWDYSALAASYDLRAEYDATLLADTLAGFGLGAQHHVLDVGAGTGKLTHRLCASGASVLACEPNAQMRARGLAQPACRDARWIAGCGEALPLRDASVDLIAYGSSFNVLDPVAALREAARVLRPRGHWLALWNHRDLDDPLQRELEAIIHRRVPRFDYGSRRRDPAKVVAASGAFEPLRRAAARFVTRVDSAAWLQAWRSHATLRGQAGAGFDALLLEFERLLRGRAQIEVPYHTRLWWTRRHAEIA